MKSIQKILENTIKPTRQQSPFQSLLLQHDRQDKLTKTFETHLPPTLQGHVRVIRLHQGRLVCSVDSSAWATQLRFQSAQILSRLRQSGEGLHVCSLDIRVNYQPVETLTLAPPKSAGCFLPQSPETVEKIALSAQIVKDPKVKAALERLIQHIRG